MQIILDTLPHIPYEFSINYQAPSPDMWGTIILPIFCALITAIATILTVILTGIGIILAQLVIKPWQEVDRLRQDVRVTMDTYCCIYTQFGILKKEEFCDAREGWDKGSKELKLLANKLRGLEDSFVFQLGLLKPIHILINKLFLYNIKQAYECLTGISNSYPNSRAAQVYDFKVREALNLRGGIVSKDLANRIAISAEMGNIDSI